MVSLKAGAKRSAVRVSFLWLVWLRKQQVGKGQTCLWFATSPRRAGAVGMWESRSDFQGLWETKGNLGLVFLVFHAPVISMVSSLSLRTALMVHPGE